MKWYTGDGKIQGSWLSSVHGNEISIQLVVNLVRIPKKPRGTVVESSDSSAMFVAACFFLLMPLQNAFCKYLWIERTFQVLELRRGALRSAVVSLLQSCSFFSWQNFCNAYFKKVISRVFKKDAYNRCLHLFPMQVLWEKQMKMEKIIIFGLTKNLKLVTTEIEL